METPPRAWGRLKSVEEVSSSLGNTPTCVGKTDCGKPTNNYRWKHPHVRGEDFFLSAIHHFFEETPPRAWGRLWSPARGKLRHRNTPTCVGKTQSHAFQRGGSEKHPHVRGEDLCCRYEWRTARETPPRAWGRPLSADVSLSYSGNTPTCVGKTLRDYSLFLLSRQNNIETSSFSDTSCSPDNSMSWRFGSPMP